MLKNMISKYFKKPPKALTITYSIGFAILIIAFLVLYFTVGKEMTKFISNPVEFKNYLMTYEKYSAAVFVAIRAFQTVIKIIPAEPLEIASGYAFGTWGGLLYCSLGSLIGTLIILALTKMLGRKFVEAFVDTEQINSLSLIANKDNRRLFLVIFYLIPGTPKDIGTYIAGLTNWNLTEFLIITTIMRMPSIITSTYCGNALGEKKIGLAVGVFVATAVVSVLCGYFYKKKSEKEPLMV